MKDFELHFQSNILLDKCCGGLHVVGQNFPSLETSFAVEDTYF